MRNDVEMYVWNVECFNNKAISRQVDQMSDVSDMTTEKKRSSSFITPADVDKEHCPKRIRSAEPDVKVIVGGEAFYHYGVLLSLASEYFDSMLSSDMIEGETKVVEVPDKDPKEWRQLFQFFDSRTSAPGGELTEEDYRYIKLLPWFSELRIKEGLNHCDVILKDRILKNKMKKGSELKITVGNAKAYFRCEVPLLSMDFQILMNEAELCTRFSLPNAMDESLLILKKVLERNMFFLCSNWLARQLVLLLKDETTRNYLLPTLLKKLPDDIIPDMEPKELVDSLLLPCVIMQEAHVDRLKYKC